MATRPKRIPEHNQLLLYAANRYLGPITAQRDGLTQVRGKHDQAMLRNLISLGYITIENNEVSRGKIEVTDAGRDYLRSV